MAEEIEKLIAFVGVDAKGDETGVVAMTIGNENFPMVTAMKGSAPGYMLEYMRTAAQKIATATKTTVREVEFVRNRLFDHRGT